MFPMVMVLMKYSPLALMNAVLTILKKRDISLDKAANLTGTPSKAHRSTVL